MIKGKLMNILFYYSLIWIGFTVIYYSYTVLFQGTDQYLIDTILLIPVLALLVLIFIRRNNKSV